jgi:hypothetical protein
MAMVFLILIIAFFVLLFLTFRPPAPQLSRLFFFLGLLAVSGILAYLFLVQVLGWNPNPSKINLAHRLMQDKFIDLAEVAPGVFDLSYIHLIDADVPSTDDSEKDSEPANPTEQEWLVFYRYDVVDPNPENPEGPIGAAVYGLVNCRPASILSYELVPIGYNYLGEDGATVQVENLIEYLDPLSVKDGVALDRPEILVLGSTRGAVTDLNVFRKTGVQLDCLQQRQWQAAHPGEAFPNAIRYENVGSFHGSYLIQRNGADISVVDRSVFERSQIVVRKLYQPQDGSYFKPGTQVLLEPVAYGLSFGPGEPQDVPQVYYPEKAVLAFYQALGKDKDELEQAQGYLSEGAQGRYDIESDPFGLSTDPASVAQARDDLEDVLVLEIGYVPDVEAERLRQTRAVAVTVVGVNADKQVDTAHPCRVVWTVIGVPRDKAIPYGCEWRLDEYQSTCQP